MAATIMVDSVCADPSKIDNPGKVAATLASILQADRAVIQKRLSSTKNFCWIARRIEPEQASAVQEQAIEGFSSSKSPNGSIQWRAGGHLIGFVGLDARASRARNSSTTSSQGHPEKLFWTRDAKGQRLYPRVERNEASPQENYNVVLTIDSRIQHLVESHLKTAVKDKRPKGLRDRHGPPDG